MRAIMAGAFMVLMAAGASWGEPTTQAKEAALEPSKITLEVKDAPLEEVLKELARQSGNRELGTSQELSDKKAKVTVQLKDTPYWEAVNAVCRSVGAYVGLKQEDIGYAPELGVRTEEVLDMCAVAGPTMVKVTEANRMIQKSVPMQKNQKAYDTSRLSFNLAAMTEERLPVAEMDVTVSKVVTMDGVNRLTAPQGKMWMMAGKLTGSPGLVTNANVGLEDAEGMIQGEVKVEGSVTLIYGTGTKELKLEKVTLGKKGEASAEGRKFIVQNARQEFPGGLTVDIEVQDKAGVPMWTRGDSNYGIFLVGPDGTRHIGRGMMTQEGETTMKAKAYFQEVGKLEGDWTLVYVYPEKVTKKTYEFAIDGVRVP